MKKLLVLILAGLVLCSCGRVVTDKPSESGGTTAVTEAAPDFPDKDYGGAEFRILCRTSGTAFYADSFITANDIAGEVVQKALTDRNRLAEEKYKVRVTAEDCDPSAEAEKRMNAGQYDFSLIYDKGASLGKLALEGALSDLAQVDGLSLEESYHFPQTAEGLTVAGTLYTAHSAVSMSPIKYGGLYCFNNDVITELGLASPYDLVEGGCWTYEKVYEMVMAAEKDMNEDGEITHGDRIGGISGKTILHGVCNSPILRDNGDGSYTLTPYSEDDVLAYQQWKAKLDEVEYFDVYYSVGVDLNEYHVEINDPSDKFSHFREGRSLFYNGDFETVKYFGDMGSSLGIVPLPVAHAGDEYKSVVYNYAYLFAMPREMPDREMAAVVYDYMAYESERLVLPAYYKEVVPSADAQQMKMLGIIRDTLSCNWTEVYLPDSKIHTLRTKFLSGGSFASVVKRYGDVVQKEIDDTVAKLTQKSE